MAALGSRVRASLKRKSGAKNKKNDMRASAAGPHVMIAMG